jgi:hypothetical protein
VGKELNVKLGMKRCLVSERQSGRHQERSGIRMGGNGLDENGDASKCTAVRLVLPGRLLPTVRFASRGVCCEQDIGIRPGCFCRQVLGIRHAPGASSGKINESRAAGAAVGRETDGDVDQVRAAAAGLNEKPNQPGCAAARRLPWRCPIGT